MPSELELPLKLPEKDQPRSSCATAGRAMPTIRTTAHAILIRGTLLSLPFFYPCPRNVNARLIKSFGISRDGRTHALISRKNARALLRLRANALALRGPCLQIGTWVNRGF